MPACHSQGLVAPQPACTRGQPTRITIDPKNDNRFAYPHGKSVFMRRLDDLNQGEQYTEHSYATTVARFSPSGFYMASGDAAGHVRIWDVTQPTHILKATYHIFAGGVVTDISWSADCSHMIVVGEGKEKFAHAFLVDTGASVGEVGGHCKRVSGVAIKPTRPYRAVTVSDDGAANFYTGTPYKFVKSIHDHGGKFVMCVKYAPDGSTFATGGADSKIFIYNGDSGERMGELAGHTASVLAVEWAPVADGQQTSKMLLSASLDQTVRLWDTATMTLLKTINIAQGAANVAFQQVGLAWGANTVMSLSLNGELNVLNLQEGNVTRRLTGLSKSICALANDPGSPAENYFAASFDGQICHWDKSGNAHAAMSLPLVSSLATNTSTARTFALNANNGALFSLPKDISGVGSSSSSGDAQVASFASVRDLIAFAPLDDNTHVVLGKNELALFNQQTGAKTASVPLKSDATALAVSTKAGLCAIGDADKNVTIFSLPGCNKVEGAALEANVGAVTCLEFSPDAAHLAVGDDQRRVKIYSTAGWKVRSGPWCFHSAKISVLAWSPNGNLLVSGSLDNSLYGWSLDDTPSKFSFFVKGAHSGAITGLKFCTTDCLLSSAQDGTIRRWTIS